MARAYQTYAAHAFTPDAGQDPIEGEIFFTTLSMTFRADETIIDVPLSELTAELDSAGDGRVIFRQSGPEGWTIATHDTSVLECRSVPQIAEIAGELESRLTRREISRRVKMVAVFFAGAGLVLWLGMLGVGAMVRSIVAKVPPEVERKIGSESLEEIKTEFEFVQDTNVAAQLAATAQPLLNVMPKGQQWQFYVIDEEYPNAFALPGGHILITTGLLEMTDRPEQLLGVLAHELAHVTEKHGFRKLVASAGPLLVLQVFVSGNNGALAVLGGGSALLVAQSFSQEYEKEADDAGWQYLVKARIDPRGMLEIFRKLQREQ